MVDVEDWRRKHLEARGLPELSDEGETVLQVLLNWAWRRSDGWVPTNCPRPTVRDEGWYPHIDHLISIGRITPRTVDEQQGWVVPSAKQWRAMRG